MEAQDSLNKYGRVKEAFVFEATEDSIKKKQLATPNRRGRTDKKLGSGIQMKQLLIPVLVALPLLTAAFIWQTFTSSDSGTNTEFVSLAGASQVPPENGQGNSGQAQVLVGVNSETENSDSEKTTTPVSTAPSVTLVSSTTEVKNVDESKRPNSNIIPASLSSKEKPVKARTYVWIVFSAADQNEADLKKTEFANEGVEVFQFEKRTVKGNRIRLAWANTFSSFSKANAVELPSIFSPESWLYELN